MSEHFEWRYASDGTNPPAEQSAIDALEDGLGVDLTEELRAFFRISNGFNGVFDRRGHYARLFSLSEVLSATTGYDVVRSLGQLVLLGDNGGDYFFALDYSANPPTYVGLSLFAESRDAFTSLGSNFAEFVEALAAGRA